ncbi:MAG TPA: hypothetical protein DCM10_05395 [Xanthomarina gelatinilytica]|nr:hypothetical protein [Xanthomarina gelatinilytica]
MINVISGAKLGPGEIEAISRIVKLDKWLGKKIKNRWIGFGSITEMPDGTIKFNRAKGMFQFK